MIFNIENVDINISSASVEEILGAIKKENPGFWQLFIDYKDDDDIREGIYNYFYELEIHCLQSCHMNSVQRYYSQQAIRVLKNLFSTRHESIAHFSVLKSLRKCLNEDFSDIRLGLAFEILFLLRALKGTRNLEQFTHQNLSAKELEWSQFDQISKEVKHWMSRYPSGLDEKVIKQRLINKENIQRKLDISDKEWYDWDWQRTNLITDAQSLEKFITLTDEEKQGINLANENGIPFGITPYYLSLLDLDNTKTANRNDYGVRTHALPSLPCILSAIELKKLSKDNIKKSDEKQLPQEISITRGYPMIAVIKPMQTNSRSLLLYGERNWDVNYALWKRNLMDLDKVEKATRWFKRHKEVSEVLIAGDILIFDDTIIENILSKLADIPHIQRIRVSTRVPVILPTRITDSLVHLLSSYQIPGRRGISLMTHFEHSYEVTIEALKGIQKLRKAGIQMYNQSIYTMENAKRFEMAALRKQLRLIGIDPYYSINTKRDVMENRVPIARMIQEQNEESRLAPGIDRADEAVFNIPGVGKNYLRASQEHELIMILSDGSRVYEFYPSDVYLLNRKPFIYRDVPIYTFLKKLAEKGENIKEYQSIWFYY